MSEDFKVLIEEIEASIGAKFNDLDAAFMENYDTQTLGIYLNHEKATIPTYAYGSDSGFDLRCVEYCVIPPRGRLKVRTGICFDIPENFEIQIRPKSGLADKFGLTVLNSPGTIDSGYTDEVEVIIYNTEDKPHAFNVGDKIAQAVLCPVQCGNNVKFNKLDKIPEKDRNNNGFGSTGLK